jgi:hypothetical protein
MKQNKMTLQDFAGTSHFIDEVKCQLDAFDIVLNDGIAAWKDIFITAIDIKLEQMNLMVKDPEYKEDLTELRIILLLNQLLVKLALQSDN